MKDKFKNLTKDILEVAEEQGFVLAGGQALVAHDLSDRPSKDIDIFTNNTSTENFTKTIDKITKHLSKLGYKSTINKQYETYTQIDFETPEGEKLGADFGVDFRNYPPAQMDFGPTLDVKDAIGNKINALYGRSEARDNLDLYYLSQNSNYTVDEMIEYANESVHNNLDRYFLSTAIKAHKRFKDDYYQKLGLSESKIQHFHETLDNIAANLKTETSTKNIPKRRIDHTIKSQNALNSLNKNPGINRK